MFEFWVYVHFLGLGSSFVFRFWVFGSGFEFGLWV